jgi:hypothetical protein
MYMDMAEVLLYAAEVSTILTFPADSRVGD